MTVTISKRKKIWQIKNPEFRINLEDSHLCVKDIMKCSKRKVQCDVPSTNTLTGWAFRLSSGSRWDKTWRDQPRVHPHPPARDWHIAQRLQVTAIATVIRERQWFMFCLVLLFVCGRKEGRKEGNVLSNDALHTFYLRLYGVRHMVKDHSDSESRNPLLPHRLLFPINSKVFLYAQTE